MDTPLLKELHENGELSTRSYRLLSKAGYKNLWQVGNLSATELLDMHLGSKAIEELNQLAEKYEVNGSPKRLAFWKLDHVRSIDITGLTEEHFSTVGDMLDALETEYISFSDLCAVYRYLQENSTPDNLLKPIRQRMIKEAPAWMMDLEIDWGKVRPCLSEALKKKSCNKIIDLVALERTKDDGLDSVERVELKNLIDFALTQAMI